MNQKQMKWKKTNSMTSVQSTNTKYSQWINIVLFLKAPVNAFAILPNKTTNIVIENHNYQLQSKNKQAIRLKSVT